MKVKDKMRNQVGNSNCKKNDNLEELNMEYWHDGYSNKLMRVAASVKYMQRSFHGVKLQNVDWGF